MKSDVELAFGFSFSIVATGTPVFCEMTPKVSPALTVQNLAVVVEREVVATVRVEAVGVLASPRRPERTSTTAIVTASRKTTGAAYRRTSPSRANAYQPEAAQISRLSRAASAPAAVR
jgi:hypothetical protein